MGKVKIEVNLKIVTNYTGRISNQLHLLHTYLMMNLKSSQTKSLELSKERNNSILTKSNRKMKKDVRKTR